MEPNNQALNKALVNAVHAIANKKLKSITNTAAQAIRAQQTGNIAEKNRTIKQLQEELNAAKASVTTATAASPSTPAAPAVVSNVNKLIANVQKGNANRMSNNNFKKRPNYMAANNKDRVNQALAKRREAVRNELISQFGTNPFFNAARNNRFNFLTNANKQAIRNAAAAASQPQP
jgi:hypothetical protein